MEMSADLQPQFALTADLEVITISRVDCTVIKNELIDWQARRAVRNFMF